MWDLFLNDRLETLRSWDTDAVRKALARGELRPSDLIRPAGSSVPWTRLADMPSLAKPRASAASPPPPPEAGAADAGEDFEEFEVVEDEPEEFEVVPDDEPEADEPLEFEVVEDDEPAEIPAAASASPPPARPIRAEAVAPPAAGAVEEAAEDEEEYDPQEEDEEAAEFTLSRGSAETVEELDLAAMVDVAFQLVLFFLVTATTVLYKSLEVPRPNPESPPEAVAQGRSNTLDDMKGKYILVEIDPSGTMKIDREPVAAEMDALVARLRAAREQTGRTAMLLSADFSTPHRHAVLAYDAANEIGLGIAIARPAPNPAPAGAPG